ncbi:MAG: phosphoglycerate dehydrogenase [Oscillospiraceae bacterium]
MFKIRTFNNISNIIHDELDSDIFKISDSEQKFEGALVRSADLQNTEMPEELLAIARAGAGYNNIPVDECSKKGVVVFNTPGANANAVKELVMCGLLMSCRKVSESMQWLKEQSDAGEQGLDKLAEKHKNQFVGPELAGKKLGVIGLGAIGVMVANAASQGLDMEVCGFDPFMSVDAAWHLSRSVKQAKNIDDLYRKCDFITIHIPLNDKTRGMIGTQQLSLMKSEAVLLNFARGGLVDDDAVLQALEDGRLRRYVTDFPNDKLACRSGVLIFPHLGASTPESEENCAKMAAKELKYYLTEGNIRNSVNMPSCELPRTSEVRLAIINRNEINMVGQITAVLARGKCNISHMINKSRGELAYTIIDVDCAVSNECLDDIKAIDGVIRVRVL